MAIEGIRLTKKSQRSQMGHKQSLTALAHVDKEDVRWQKKRVMIG